MADQSSHSSSLPSSPSPAQITAKEVAFLGASRHLAVQLKLITRITKKPRQKPLVARPLQIRKGQSTESAPLLTLSSESEKKRRDDREVFGRILSNMEKEGGLPEAGVVNQPLPLEEEMEEASRRSALAVSDPKETIQTESYEEPIRVALKEVEVKKLPKMVEEKKNKKNRAEGDEEAQPRKEKKERKSSEKSERRREGKRLKAKEEKRKRAESLEVDGESTTTKVDEGCQRNKENQRNLKRNQCK
ncbi:nucleolar protein 58-like [Benincasa hispida]|uniref:nucleolar protein 58-like n=1 Tax=Benincasa hispida TaxID=102211 RepID=UPI00190092E2|nr:nucleolar protein 58-like [Benincasa hispida]